MLTNCSLIQPELEKLGVGEGDPEEEGWNFLEQEIFLPKQILFIKKKCFQPTNNVTNMNLRQYAHQFCFQPAPFCTSFY